MVVPATAFGQTRPCPPDLTGAPKNSCGEGSSQGVPGWFASLNDLEAAAPVTNWLGASDVKDPRANVHGSHEAIITAWTGMGIDQQARTAFMLHNGGHNDYHGNEVYSVDLSKESPAWIRRRDASPADGSGYITKFSDGRPCSDHTANLYVAAEGRWFTCGMNSTNYNGGSARQQWWEYDPRIDDYIDLGTNHESFGGSFGTTVYDKNARQVISIHDNNNQPSVTFTSLDNMRGPAAVENRTPLNISRSLMAAVDTTNRILLMRSGSFYRWLKIDSDANRQGSMNTPSVSGSAPNSLYQIYWHAPSQAFITWGGGNRIAKLKPTVSNGGYTSLTWSSVAVSGVSLPSSGPPAGMFDKVNLIEDMGNGDSGLVIVPRYGNPDTYVIRIIGSI
jgi:hypothetical protein